MPKGKDYQQIREGLRERLRKGEWREGERMPSYRKLAAEYTCSVNTVEKALRALEEEGLLQRGDRRRTVVQSRGTDTRKSGLVGAFVLAIDNPIWVSVLRGIEDRLHQDGFSMISVSHEQRADKLRTALENLLNANIDGVLLSPIEHSKEERRIFYETMDFLRRRQIRVVFIDWFRHDLDIPYVTSDNISASYRLTKLLIDHGHRQIGFVRVTQVSTVLRRLDGFRQACEEEGLPYRDDWDFFIETQEEDFKDEMEFFSGHLLELLKKHPVTALFASNDQTAKAIIETLKKTDLQIPRDISLVTYDVDHIRESYPFRLTGVQQDLYGLGQQSAGLMMEMIRGEIKQDGLTGRVVPSRIVTGDSVRTLPGFTPLPTESEPSV